MSNEIRMQQQAAAEELAERASPDKGWSKGRQAYAVQLGRDVLALKQQVVYLQRDVKEAVTLLVGEKVETSVSTDAREVIEAPQVPKDRIPELVKKMGALELCMSTIEELRGRVEDIRDEIARL
ncbi:MAG: hypothetical protein ACOC6F_04240 [bacterium]